VAIVFLGSVGYVLLTTYHGARGIDTKLVDAARSFSVGGVALYSKVLLPAVLVGNSNANVAMVKSAYHWH
jgi:ABC-type nitrate/sulfonate/bicarbonate transport system permease component